MKRFRQWFSKKYLQRILVTVTVVIVLLVLFSSLTLYLYSERTVLDVHGRANDRVLSQINYNIKYMNEIAKSTASYLFFDDEVELLRQAKELDNYYYIRSINKLDAVISSSSFVDSLFIYNHYHDDFFIGSGTVRQSADEQLRDSLKEFIRSDSMARMQFIPYSFEFQQAQQNFDTFLFAMYEPDPNGVVDNMLLMAISPEWIFENIKQLNQSDAAGSSFLIMDGNQQLLFKQRQTSVLTEDEQSEVNAFIEKREADKGAFTINKGENRKVVTYLDTGINNWVVLNIEPYDSVMQEVLRLRNTSILIIAVFLNIAITVAIIASNTLYKPVDTFIRQLRRQGEEWGGDPKDTKIGPDHEFNYVTSKYKQMVEKLKLVRKDSEEKETIVKSFYIRKLLLNSPSITGEELQQFFQNNPIYEGTDDRYAVCVLKIDHLHDFDMNTSLEDKRLYYFAISNIAGELLAEHFGAETVDMRRDHMAAIIVMPKERRARFLEDITPVLAQIQEVTKRYYKLSLTVSVSEPFVDIRETTDYYSQALRYSMYRLRYGHQSIITPGMVAEDADPEFYIAEEQERKLVDGLKASDFEAIKLFVSSYMAMARELHYDQMMQAFHQVILLTRRTLKEMNGYKLKPVAVDLNRIHQRVLEKETIDEIEQVLLEFYEELIGEMKSIPSLEKNNVLLDTIKELVQVNYTDVNLSLQSVATMLNMSASYVGRSFKKSEGISVAEFINEIRLTRAEELLTNKDFSVTEIMEQVGFINQSQFFKLFKKKFGATPREYRLKKLIE